MLLTKTAGLAGLLLIGCLLVCPKPAAAQAKRRLGVVVSITRSAPLRERDFHFKQFSASVALVVRVTKRLSFNVGLSQNFESRPVALRTGFTFRIR